MKRAYRLRRPEQFQRTRRSGRRFETPLLVLQAVANRRSVTRCGFVVTKRVGGAVERNRAKRRVREAVRLVYNHIAPGWDLVFVVRSSDVATVEFTKLQATVERLLQQARLWHELPSDTQVR